MSGIRIRHPNSGAALYTIVSDRPLQAPMLCMRCSRTHDFKTYHIDLDDQGTAIVSETVWGKLQEIPNQPFSLVNTVAKPPTIVLDLRRNLEFDKPLVTHEENP
jgi:hypothetical protein